MKNVFDDVEENNTNQLNQIAMLPVNIAFTKDSIADAVETMLQKIEDDGDDDVLGVYTKCTALIEYLTKLKKAVQPHVEDEVSKYEKGDVASKNGIKLVLSSSAANFDYSGYEGWVAQKEIVDGATEELKRIEGLMKKAEGTAGIIDEDTGEVVPPRVKTKEGATVIRATIPKS